MSSARTVTFPGVVSPGMTLYPLRRGPGDPTFQVDDDGAIWRTSLLPSGSVTARISRATANAVDCTAWGSGAEEFLDAVPAMLGTQHCRKGVEELLSAAAPRRAIDGIGGSAADASRDGPTGQQAGAPDGAVVIDLESRIARSSPQRGKGHARAHHPGKRHRASATHHLLPPDTATARFDEHRSESAHTSLSGASLTGTVFHVRMAR